MTELPKESIRSSSSSAERRGVDHDYRLEFVRKAIHLFSLSIPVIYWFVSHSTAINILVSLTLVFLIVDVARYYSKPLAGRFYKLFGRVLRGREQDEKTKRLNGATYVLIGSTLTIILFPKVIAVTSLTVLILSDSMAALIGRRFGKRKFLAKSLEGSLAFFFSGLVVIALAPKALYLPVEYLFGGIAVAVGAVVEAAGLKIDDNFLVPLTIGGVLLLFYVLFFPGFDLSTIGQV